MENNDCIFCKIISKDAPAKIISEGDNFIVIENIQPVSKGHCLILPKKHYVDTLEMPSLLGNELIKMIKEQILRLKKDESADGIKIIQNNGSAAGQSVFHYHVHVIPEKEGVKRDSFV